MLVEQGKDRQLYQLATDHGDFKLFAKYRSKPSTINEDYISWSFVFTDSDVEELSVMVRNQENLIVGLVCATEDSTRNQVAFLQKNDIIELFAAGKGSLTIGHQKGEHYFKIKMLGGRENDRRIKCNSSLV